MSNEIAGRFRNATLCEDIRDELGNKKSLMGVFSGDILVAEFPAQIRIAIYLEFIPEASNSKQNIEVLLWQDSIEMVRAKLEVETGGGVAAIVLPQAIGVFSDPCDFIVSVSVNEGAALEIMRKKVLKGPIPR